MSANLSTIKEKPEPKRDRWSRYLIPTGPKRGLEPYTRATTVAKGVGDTYGLERWQMGQVANGMGRKPALVKLARSHPHYDEAKSTYREIVDAAFEASDGADGRRAGTALHKQTERLDLGLISTSDPDLDPDDRARLIEYETTLEANGIKVVRNHIEEILLLKGLEDPDDRTGAADGWRLAGTSDRFLDLADNRRVIGDLKCGKAVDLGALEWAVQLSIYANHNHRYDAANDAVRKRIECDRTEGIIIHLPSQGEVSCQLYTIDLEVGYGALLCAMERREWQKERSNVLKPYRVTSPGSGGATAQRDWLAERIHGILAASDDEAAQEMANGERMNASALLVALWEMTDVPMPLPPTLTTEQIENMDAMCSAVEQKFELAISASPPGGTR